MLGMLAVLGLLMLFSWGRRAASVVALVLLLVLTVASWSGMADLRSDYREISKARAAEESGDLRSAASLYQTVFVRNPKSTMAHLYHACLTWRAGYRDQAALSYSSALAVGWPPWAEFNEPGCFLENPSALGFRLIEWEGRPFLVKLPETTDSQSSQWLRVFGSRLEAYRSGMQTLDLATAVLAGFCLSDRADYRLLASQLLQSGSIMLEGDDSFDQLPSTIDDCIDAASEHYQLVESELAPGFRIVPTDGELRLLDTEES